MMAQCLSTVGEPRREILHTPIFSRWPLVYDMFLLQGKMLLLSMDILVLGY